MTAIHWPRRKVGDCEPVFGVATEFVVRLEVVLFPGAVLPAGGLRSAFPEAAGVGSELGWTAGALAWGSEPVRMLSSVVDGLELPLVRMKANAATIAAPATTAAPMALCDRLGFRPEPWLDGVALLCFLLAARAGGFR
jgi:hypothetical protein